jgi:hypothetical protein
LVKVSTEMALNVLAYNIKRVIAIVGVGALLEAMTSEVRAVMTPGGSLRVLTGVIQQVPAILAACTHRAKSPERA